MLTLDNKIKQFGGRMLAQQEAASSRASARLASGKRINSAKDDSAGFQIADRLKTLSFANIQLQRNLQDGISYSQVAEGALGQVTSMVQRMRQLALQSANGSNNTSDRQALDKEYQQLAQEIDRTAYNTQIFGKYPLLPSQQPTNENIKNVDTINNVLTSGQTESGLTSGLKSIAYIPAGSTNLNFNLNSFGADDDLELFTADGVHVVGTSIYTDNVWSDNGVSDPTTIKSKFFNAADGYNVSASYDDSSLLSSAGTSTYNGMNITYTGDQHAIGIYTENITIDKTTKDLILAVVGSNGVFDITANWDSIGNGESQPLNTPPFGPGMQITATETPVESSDFIAIDKTPARIDDLGLTDTALDPIEKAMAAISSLDGALTTLGSHQGYHGAKMNAMDAISRNAQSYYENNEAARMRIEDADFATETAVLNQNEILNQATTAVLSQANSSGSMALDLLKNSSE